MNASKIIRKQAINKAKSSFNDKLKKAVKLETQRELIQDDKNNSNDINFTKKAVDKFASISSKAIALLPMKWIAIGLACLLLLLLSVSAISCVSSVASVGANATPNITPEVKEKIVKLMEDLDKSCGKKLSSNFTIEGSSEVDWRTVLALTVAAYKNDLSAFDEKVQTNVSLGSGNYAELVQHYSEINGLDPYVVCGLIMQESAWNKDAGSPVGAVGLMQLMEATAIENGCFDRYDPEQNISAGCKYLKKCYEYFPNDERLALAAYNAGPGNAEEYINTVPETMEYPGKVLGYAEQYRNGELKIPNSGESGSNVTVQTNKGKMQEIYEVVNVVSPDHNSIKRNSFEEAIHELNFDGDQISLANALYEGNMWEEVFGDDFDFSFKINGSFSGNSSNGNVTMVNGERKGNQAIIDLAMGELGNNGDKYTDWYGLSRGTPYCNIFVTWLMYNTSDNLYNGQYPSKTECNDAYTVATSQWFMEQNRWGDRNYDKLVAGDIIYFDWDGGGVDHVGIVKSVENDFIITIEGNSTNALVCENKYRRDSSVIFGYGLMNY